MSTPTSLIALHDEQLILVSPKPRHLLPPPAPPLEAVQSKYYFCTWPDQPIKDQVLSVRTKMFVFKLKMLKNAASLGLSVLFGREWGTGATSVTGASTLTRMKRVYMHDRSLLLRMQQKVAVTLSSFSISPMDLPSLFALINLCLFFRNA